MADRRLRVLHVSDLHARAGREKDRWRRRRVLGDAWARNLDELLEDGPLDLVCFTGDLADFAEADEYGEVTELVKALLDRVRLPVERFFPVPGNHDVHRGTHAEAWGRLRPELLRTDELARSWWLLPGGRAPRGLATSDLDAVLERGARYRHWLEHELGRPELLPDRSPHGRLGYRSSLEVNGCPVHVIGLDSAWLSGDEHDAEKLLLTEDQVMRLASDEHGDPLGGFRLGLVHHPLHALADHASARGHLATRVDLLRGHLHEEELLTTWEEPDRRLSSVAAGCLYEGHRADRWPNACHVIEVDLDGEGRPSRIEIRLRGWSAGPLVRRRRALRSARHGRYTLLDARPATRSSVLPPAGVFVGRDRHLQELERRLLAGPDDADGARGQHVTVSAVWGMAGVGKTYLADEFVRRHAAAFPGGVLQIALGPAETPSVEALTGQLADLAGLSAQGGAREALARRLADPTTLVRIENVDHGDAAAVVAELADLLIGVPMLVTGRTHELGHDAGWQQVDVSVLDRSDSKELLRQSAGSRDLMPDAELDALAAALGDLPLALALAGGYLRRGLSPSAFRERLQASGLALEPADRTHPGYRRDRARAIIATTFGLSLDQLRSEIGALADHLALGHAPVTGFGESLGSAVAGLQPAPFAELAMAAVGLSLLELHPTRACAWRVHPLLAELLRSRDDAAVGRARLDTWFREHLPEPDTSDPGSPSPWVELDAEADGLVAWLQTVPANQACTVERLGSTFAIQNGPYHVWIAFCRSALAATTDDTDRSQLLWTLGNAAWQAGDLDAALHAAREKQALDQKNGADREASLAVGLRADVLQIRGDLDEALRIRNEEEIPVYERLGDVRSRAVTMGKIADILQERGQLDEALRIRNEEEIPVYERLGDVRSRAVTMGKIADILQARGQLDEALRIRNEEQLPVYKRLGDVRSRAVTMGKIADILQERGQLDEALRIRNEEEIPVYERLGDVRSRAVTMGKIADILQERGQLDEALRIRNEEQLPVYERLGDVRELLVGRAKLGLLLQRNGRGDREEAARLLGLALEAAERLGLPEAEQIRAIQRAAGLGD